MNKVKKAGTGVANDAPVKVKKGKSLESKKARLGWFFIAPFVVGFLLLYVPMIINSIYNSFIEVKILPGGIVNKIWMGWANYSYALFEDTNFFEYFLDSMSEMFINMITIVIFSLFMAIILNQKMRGRAFFRAIFFIPVIVSTGLIEHIDELNIIGQMQEQLTTDPSMSGGATTTAAVEIISAMDLARFFGNMRVGGELFEVISGVINRVFDIVNRSGVQMLIFLAGLQSISPAIYESCYMEGASGWETFWKITFPMISPMILVNTIYTVIDAFTSQSNTIMRYITVTVYNQPKGQTRAAAMSWMYFLVIILILAVIGGILSAYIFYQRKD